MSAKRLPVACSLPIRESRDQIGEWHSLLSHQVATERVDGGYAVTYHSDVASLVEDLVAREMACCGFLDIATTPTEAGIRMAMTSENPDALPVIEMLVAHDAAAT